MSIRWASWRRDLAFAVAGVVVASAVLVPLWLSQVRAEHQRAEAAEREAAMQRALAVEQPQIALQLADRAAMERRVAQYRDREVSGEPIESIDGEPRVSKIRKAMERIEALEAENRKLIPDMPAPIPPALP